MSNPAKASGEAFGRPVDRKAIAAWCLYDWANSAIPAVVLTFIFATYVTQGVAEDDATGTAHWATAITLSTLAIAILSPILGPIADRSGRRKPWLAGFTLITVAATAGLWWVEPEPSSLLLALILVFLINVGFELGIVFYNAMLPDLAPQRLVGRVSGWAWGLGYAGGLVCLVVALVVFIQVETPPFGLDRSAEAREHVRITGVLAALWLALFALPLFLLTPDRPSERMPMRAAVVAGLRDLAATIRLLRRHMNIARYLIAHMFYRDGLNTLFLFGGVFAGTVFGMGQEEVLMFGIALNISAGIGAFGFAWLDDRVGGKTTIMVGLLAILAITLALLMTTDKTVFWVLGVLLGVFFGPVQSASRSLMARLAPEGQEAQMFGLFAMSGKATAFLGPLVLSQVALHFDSERLGMATVLLFMGGGLLMLLRVREPRAA